MSGTTPTKTDRLTPVDDSSGRTVYRDPDRGTYHVWYDAATYEPVSTAVLFAVSSVLDAEPDDLEPLADAVEPDALNELCVHWRRREPPAADGSVSFSFAQCRVTVWADGEIVIDPDPAVDPAGSD